ncbi:hypothetical protein WA158_007855 [Blastocystis sp. Blastoise]
MDSSEPLKEKKFTEVSKLERVGFRLWSFLTFVQIIYVLRLVCPDSFFDFLGLPFVFPWEYLLSFSSFVGMTIIIYFVGNYGLLFYLANDIESESAFQDSKSVSLKDSNNESRSTESELSEEENQSSFMMTQDRTLLTSLPNVDDEDRTKIFRDSDAYVPNICDIPPELWNQVLFYPNQKKE